MSDQQAQRIYIQDIFLRGKLDWESGACPRVPSV